MRSANVRSFFLSSSSLRVPSSQYSVTMENWGGVTDGKDRTLWRSGPSEVLLCSPPPPFSTETDSGLLLPPSPAAILYPHLTVCSLNSLNGSNAHRVPIPPLHGIWHVKILHSLVIWVMSLPLSYKPPVDRVCLVHTVITRSLVNMYGRTEWYTDHTAWWRELRPEVQSQVMGLRCKNWHTKSESVTSAITQEQKHHWRFSFSCLRLWRNFQRREDRNCSVLSVGKSRKI